MLASAKNGAYDRYKQQNAMTASPGELTLMLFEGGIKNLKLAKMSIGKKDYIRANEHSQKAQRIVAELMRSLDMRYELAKQMMPLYDFILNTIVESNIKKDPEKLETALQMLTDLRDTWREAVARNRKESFGGQRDCI